MTPPLRSPTLATLVYLLTGTLWLSSLGRNTGLAAWPLLFFSAALVQALFLRSAEGSPPPPPSAPPISVDNLPDVALVVRDGVLSDWNAVAEHVCGLDERWRGRRVEQLFIEEDVPALRAGLAASAFTARLGLADGSPGAYAWTVGRSGREAILLGRPAAPEPEQSLAEIIDVAPELVAVVVDGRIAFINGTGEQMLGARRETLIGRAWDEVCVGGGDGFDYRLLRDDGASFEAGVNTRPLLFGGRRATLFQVRDITELARAMRKLGDSARRYEAITGAVADAVVITGTDGIVRSVNPAAERLFGHPASEAMGRPLDTLLTPVKDRGGLLHARRKDGSKLPVEISEADVSQSDGDLRAVAIRDISERRAAESRLLVAAAVLESTVEGIMVTDPRGVITWVNNAFCKISGYGRDEVIGENASLLKSGFQGLTFYKTMWQHIRSAGLWEGEIWNRRKDGETYLEWLSIKAVTDEAGSVSAYVGVFSDLSRHKRAEETIKHLTYYDAVTRLPNSYLFRDRAALAIEHGQRDHRMVALVLVSLDRFKQVNETLGHATGDALLREVAERLSRAVRGQDTVARLRGDTFCCVLTELGQAPEAQPVIDRMMEAFTSSFEPNGHELFATASVGISVFPVDGSDVDDLVQKAETAMNRSKDAVDSTYNFYTPEMNANSRERLRLETELRKAVQQEDFVLHYQPKVETETGRLVGAEALLRWHHPELGVVSPAKFIPIAEETGLILQLGAWVLRAACRQLRDWQARGLPLVRVAVNLSAHQFRQPDLVETIVGLLADTGVEANLIELELTESAVMHNADIAVGRMLELNAAGIRLAIDDFGTGYSSLAHLKRFPLDQLKIDRSFIQDLCSNQAGEEIVGAIIAMAHGLNLSVVAEGVEKAAQRDLLAKLRCDQIQGFFFSPAVPPDRFAEMLTTGRLAGQDV